MGKELIEQFKRDLRSYRTYKQIIKDYDYRIEELNTKLINVKSPALDTVPVHNGTDNRLSLIAARDKVEEKAKAYRVLVNNIDKCLDRLTKEESDILMLAYMEHVRFAKIAKVYYVSEASIYRWVDRIIIKAIDEDGGFGNDSDTEN